jgi:hypothetical protein
LVWNREEGNKGIDNENNDRAVIAQKVIGRKNAFASKRFFANIHKKSCL